MRSELAITVTTLEEDLRHIERSIRVGGQRLRIRSAVCVGCGFRLSRKPFHKPGRYPKCRSSSLDAPWRHIP
jgi:predicted Zn-ribbon and HTH transcriptional regulator